MAISPVLDLAARALRAQETVLQTVGHNIANQSTPGYSRQDAVLVSERAQQLGGLTIGSGVGVATVRQTVDSLLEAQLLRARSDQAQQGRAQSQLARVEEIFSDLDGQGLRGALDDFFAAADDLALHPEGIAERTTLLAKAESLARYFRDHAAQLAQVQRDAEDGVTSAVARVNALSDQIAGLNREIAHAEITGQTANDLRDQRREALGQLADLVGVSQYENEQGVTVLGPGGVALVEGGRVTHLAADQATNPSVGLDGRALSTVGFLGPNDAFIALPATAITGGELGGLLAVRDGHVPDVAADLDTLANALQTAVNAVQSDAGASDLDGAVGTDLFGGSGAADLTVLITDPRKLAASLTGSPEDNQNARALAAVGSDAQASLGGSTLSGFLATTVASVGALSQDAADRATAAEALTAQLRTRREAVSGVSLNEELVKLLSAQRAFQAAATLINVTNTTLDALFSILT
jgi:flagellar hook-associated protein 1 FlgK